jgi:hypothetical protein
MLSIDITSLPDSHGSSIPNTCPRSHLCLVGLHSHSAEIHDVENLILDALAYEPRSALRARTIRRGYATRPSYHMPTAHLGFFQECYRWVVTQF